MRFHRAHTQGGLARHPQLERQRSSRTVSPILYRGHRQSSRRVKSSSSITAPPMAAPNGSVRIIRTVHAFSRCRRISASAAVRTPASALRRTISSFCSTAICASSRISSRRLPMASPMKTVFAVSCQIFSLRSRQTPRGNLAYGRMAGGRDGSAARGPSRRPGRRSPLPLLLWRRRLLRLPPPQIL